MRRSIPNESSPPLQTATTVHATRFESSDESSNRGFHRYSSSLFTDRESGPPVTSSRGTLEIVYSRLSELKGVAQRTTNERQHRGTSEIPENFQRFCILIDSLTIFSREMFLVRIGSSHTALRFGQAKKYKQRCGRHPISNS